MTGDRRRVEALFGIEKGQKTKDEHERTLTGCGVRPGSLAFASERGWGMTGIGQQSATGRGPVRIETNVRKGKLTWRKLTGCGVWPGGLAVASERGWG